MMATTTASDTTLNALTTTTKTMQMEHHHSSVVSTTTTPHREKRSMVSSSAMMTIPSPSLRRSRTTLLPKNRSSMFRIHTTPKKNVTPLKPIYSPYSTQSFGGGGGGGGGRRNTTPSKTVLPGVDRFIPDRNYLLDPSRALQAFLFEGTNHHHHHQDDDDEKRDDDIDSTIGRRRRNDVQQQQLRRVLFGDDRNETTIGRGTPSTTQHNRLPEPSLLGIGHHGNFNKRQPQQQQQQKSWKNHPSSLDILRSPWMSPCHDDFMKTTATRSPRVVSTRSFFALGVEGISPRDDWHTISVGPQGIAVAMCKSVAFSQTDFKPFEINAHRISAVKWRSISEYDTTLCVGSEQSIQIWDVSMGIKIHVAQDQTFTYTTALEWNSTNELMASTSAEIQYYDLRLRFPHVFSFDTNRTLAAKIQLEPESEYVFAAALPDRNEVALWDMRISRLPFQTLEHAGVKGMQFCPTYRNTLATGGSDGIRLWNVQGKSLRLHTRTESAVTSLTWSWDGSEFLASFGCNLAVYKCSSGYTKLRKLEQWCRPNAGKIVAVECEMGSHSGRVVSLHCESPEGIEALICWGPFRDGERDRKRELHRDRYRLMPSLACSPVIR